MDRLNVSGHDRVSKSPKARCVMALYGRFHGLRIGTATALEDAGFESGTKFVTYLVQVSRKA